MFNNTPAIGLRIASHYVTIFWLIGFSLIYFPPWLAERGFSDVEVGYILAAAFWAKVPFNLLLGHWVDATGARRRWIALLSFIVALGIPFLWFELSLSLMILVWGITGAALAVSSPLTDNLSVLARKTPGFDYGKVRLWGSWSFILAALVGGQLFQAHGIEWVLYLMIGGAVLVLVSGVCLPDLRAPAGRFKRFALWDVLRIPGYKMCIVIAAILQSSHAVFYGFATIHWQMAGIDSATISLLWAEGVLAEILVFFFAAWFVKHLSVARLFCLAALSGVVRWTGLSLSTELPVLIGLQLLHAGTFALTHLAVFEFISQRIPPQLTASAQTLYDIVSAAVVFALAMMLAGALYEYCGGQAFLAMTGFSLAAMLLLLIGTPKLLSDR